MTGWGREEREMTAQEYEQMILMQEIVAGNTSEIVSSVTGFQKETVIDEYTIRLIEEGLL